LSASGGTGKSRVPPRIHHTLRSRGDARTDGLVRRAPASLDLTGDRGADPACPSRSRRDGPRQPGGRNHILLADEPAWPEFLAELHAFLGRAEPSVAEALPELSPRELEVLGLVSAGLDNEGIAARLYLSVRTVERHLSNIYAKLGVSGKAARAAAAARFSRLGEPSVGRTEGS
jgi:DNA-binding CsgD family transcriptional regulator